MSEARDDHPLVIAVLSRQRAEIAATVAELENQLAARRADLAHLDGVLRLLDPAIDLAALRPPKPPRNVGPFKHGELTRRIYDGLRRHGEVSAAELADAALRDHGISDEPDRRADFISRFLVRLAQMANAGRVERIGRGNGVRWKLRAFD